MNFIRKKDRIQERTAGRAKDIRRADVSIIYLWRVDDRGSCGGLEGESQSYPQIKPSDVKTDVSRFHLTVAVSHIDVNYKFFDDFF